MALTNVTHERLVGRPLLHRRSRSRRLRGGGHPGMAHGHAQEAVTAATQMAAEAKRSMTTVPSALAIDALLEERDALRRVSGEMGRPLRHRHQTVELLLDVVGGLVEVGRGNGGLELAERSVGVGRASGSSHKSNGRGRRLRYMMKVSYQNDSIQGLPGLLEGLPVGTSTHSTRPMPALITK